MMKALIRIDGQPPLVLLGLSFGNLRKFMSEPLDTFIKVEGKDMELPFDILLFSGDNEAHMLDAFKNHIGPNTKLHISDKLKS